MSTTQPDRRMLWADAVGGFLICLDDEVAIGQPAGDAGPALPIFADLSRRHAVLRREVGSYVLEPVGSVALDGSPIEGPTLLGSTHAIVLGRPDTRGPASATPRAVRLRFTRPHALSATARLEVLSGHRTQPSSDAVLLMAESCVMGPGAHSHVPCPGWGGEVILFRAGRGLRCRVEGPVTVAGVPAPTPAEIPPGGRVEGQDFAFSVEPA